MGWNPQPPTRKYRGFFFGKHGHPPPPLQLVGQGGRGGKFRAKDVGKSGEVCKNWKIPRFPGREQKKDLLKGFQETLYIYIWSAPPPERIYIYINYICYIYYSILCTMYHVLCTISVFALCIISCIYIIMYSIYYLYIIYIYIYVLRVSSNDFTISDFPIYRQILLTHSGAMRCAWQMWLGCFAAWTKRFLPWKTTRIIWKDSTICLFLL